MNECSRRLLVRQPPLSVGVLEKAKMFHEVGCGYVHRQGWGSGEQEAAEGALVRVGDAVDVAGWMWQSGCGCVGVSVVLSVKRAQARGPVRDLLFLP